MHIVHVASGREWRGGQRQTLLLARGLAAHGGIETRVFTGRDTPLARHLAGASVVTVALPWGIGLDPRALFALTRILDRGAIVHAHDNHAHALVATVAHVRRIKVVATRRLDLPIRHPARWRRADAVIALSGAVAARLVAGGVARDRIHVIPPAIDLAEVSRVSPWPTNVARPPEGVPLVVTIAALTDEKGVEVLLNAAAHVHRHMPDVRFMVLGEGPARPALLARRAQHGLEHVVALPGQVDAPEAILACATLYAQPSFSEGFGSSVLDALARGVPVIASDTGGLPDAVAGGGGQLVRPGDADALAAAIITLLADHRARTELGAAARVAAQRFGIERLVSDTLDVYRSL